MERGLNAVGASLDEQNALQQPAKIQHEDRLRQPDQYSPFTFIDLLTGQPVEEGAEWCPDCKRLAEEDRDILPPACAAHGGPPETPHEGPENPALHQGKSRLLTAREKAGLSIEQASNKLDWSIWLIKRYESGCCVPPNYCLRRFADMYGVSVFWLRDDPAWERK